jgi:hypothetical protein
MGDDRRDPVSVAVPRERLRLRELHGPDRMRAALEARGYGFPREIALEEVLLGHWFRWGAAGLFWLYSDHHCEPAEFQVHVAARPKGRLLERAEEWQAVLLVLADLLGAERLLATPTGRSAEVLGPVLARLGWTRGVRGWYLSASGGRAWGARTGRAARSAAARPSRARSSRGRARSS